MYRLRYKKIDTSSTNQAGLHQAVLNVSPQRAPPGLLALPPHPDRWPEPAPGGGGGERSIL